MENRAILAVVLRKITLQNIINMVYFIITKKEKERKCMKKLLALFLTILMTLSCFSSAVLADDADEAARLEALNEKEYTYLDISPNRDAFASFEDICTYSAFADLKTIPSATADETQITGNEYYYYKGMTSADISSVNNTVLGKGVWLIDELLQDEPGVLTGKRANGNALSYTREDVTYNAKTNTDIVSRETADDGVYVTVKNKDTRFKIGPLAADKVAKNTLMMTNSGMPVININKQGGTLAVLTPCLDVNNGVTGQVKIKPAAALMEYDVKYSDETVEKNFAVVTHNYSNQDNDTIYKTIIYAPKTTDVSDLNTLMRNENQPFKFLSQDNIEADNLGIADVSISDVVFPDGVMNSSETNKQVVKKQIKGSGKQQVASYINNRQDALINSYKNLIDYAVFDLDESKTAVSVTPVNNTGAATGYGAQGQINIHRDSKETQHDIALIPVTIPGANSDYVYYAFFGRAADCQGTFAITHAGESLADKIRKIEEKMSETGLTADEIAAIDAEIAEITADGKVKYTDFDENVRASYEEQKRKLSLDDKDETYLDLKLFMDGFSTENERSNADWYANGASKLDSDGNKTGEFNVYAYKGLNNAGYYTYPADRARTTNIMGFASYVSKRTSSTYVSIEDTAQYNSADNRYYFTMGNTKFKLGEIADEGKKGNNYVCFGAVYGDNLYNTSYGRTPEVDSTIYTLNDNNIVSAASYPVNKSGVDTINLMLTAHRVRPALKPAGAFFPVTVTYSDGTSITYWLYAGAGSKEFLDSIIAVDNSSFTDENPKTHSSLDDKYTDSVRKFKADVTYEDISPVGTKTDVNYSDSIPFANFIMPYDSKVFSSVSRNYPDYNEYVHGYEIPVDSSKTIASISTFNMAGNEVTTKLFPAIDGAYASSTTASYATAYVPVNVKGLDSKYSTYIKMERNCGFVNLFGITLSTLSSSEKIQLIENKMKSAKTAADVLAVEELKRIYIDGVKIKESDISSDVLAKYSVLKDSILLKGTVSVSEDNNKVTLTANIENIIKVSGKRCILILAFYDSNGNLISINKKDVVSTADEIFTERIENISKPAGTNTVKGFIWSGFDTLIPLNKTN